jgi:hypothetical protein
MEWHWCSCGEWHGPFTLQRINKLTAKMPNQFLMAGGGTDAAAAKIDPAWDRRLPGDVSFDSLHAGPGHIIDALDAALRQAMSRHPS